MNQEIEIIKAIHDYARGNLTEAEADQLWIRILEKPEYLDWLIM